MNDSKIMKFLRDFLGLNQYESEATRFMRDFLRQHPEEIESQRKGRGVWWDKDGRQRTEPTPVRTTGKSGGAEYTFRA